MIQPCEKSELQYLLGSDPIRIDEAFHRLRKLQTLRSKPSTFRLYEILKKCLQKEYSIVWHQGFEPLSSFVDEVEEWNEKRLICWRRRVLQLRAHYDDKIKFLKSGSTFELLEAVPNEKDLRVRLILKRAEDQCAQPPTFQILN